jgi:hypothetical protein
VNFSSLRAIGLLVLVSIAFLAIGLGLRAWYAPEWMLPDTTQTPPGMRPWAVEADCYSQLARVQRILAGQGLLQNHFDVENWPEGLTPSTTAPFDYVILLLYFLLWPFTRHPLDWAGALVSPALWLALVGFWLLIRSREFTRLGRGLLIAGSAVLPSLIWATAFGRPRHQSLILALMAMGLTAEYERWQLELAPKRAWNIFAGIVWGLACWTSLFEPVVVAGGIIVFNLIVRRRENLSFLAAFGVVLVLMTLLEGGHLIGNVRHIYELRNSPYAINWLHGIAEVVPVDLPGMVDRLSYVLLVTPVVAWCLWPRQLGNKTDMLLILLTALLTGLTLEQGRWSYYASLAALFLVVRFCQVPRTPEGESLNLAGGIERLVLVALVTPFLFWCLLLGTSPDACQLVVILLVLALIVLALLPNEWMSHLSFGNPLSTEGMGQVTPNFWMRLIVVAVLLIGSARNDEEQVVNHGKVPPIQPSLQLVKIAAAIDEPGAIMAPWWLSPGLLYFSGHPIVSGSSHEGMSGIVDSAKFFSATSWTEAEQILDRRKVRWVVVWDNPDLVYPVLANAQSILGLPRATDDNPGDAELTVVQRLNEDQLVPTAFELRAVIEDRATNQRFKLYEYVPDS